YTRFRKDFLRKHVDFPRTQSPNNNQYCDVMMMRRGMSSSGRCKDLNTFVHTDPQNVVQVCRNQPDRAIRTTRQRFPVTVCKLIRRKPSCRYRGTQRNHRVQVGCLRGLPVHLNNTFP
uniref:Ribonuclease A-domain domain-containing protein n=1 Tax=Meleagris gallopavo TaxID=9103 RepID=A0A803YER9_MELGA